MVLAKPIEPADAALPLIAPEAVTEVTATEARMVPSDLTMSTVSPTEMYCVLSTARLVIVAAA